MAGRRGKRGYKKRVVRHVDTVLHQSKCTLQENSGVETLPTKTIANLLITQIPIAGLQNAAREGLMIYLKGWRLRMTFRNNDENPKWVHCAIVNPKDPFPNVATQQNQWNGTNFFRTIGNPTRSSDSGLLLNGLEWATNPINTDEYNVLWHMRFRLGPRFAQTTQPFTTGTGAPNYRTLNRFIKCGKKISYVDDRIDRCHQPFYFLTWATSLEEAVGEPAAGSAIVIQNNIVTYFSDARQ